MTLRKMTDTTFEEVARRFRVLSDPMRLKILYHIGLEELSVGQIVESPLHAATMELSSIAPAQLNGQGGEVPPTIAEERI